MKKSIIVIFVLGLTASASGAESKIEPTRKPASVYVKQIGEIKSGQIIKIWDEEMKVVCYAVSGAKPDSGSTNAPSNPDFSSPQSGSSIFCVQK
jgi:hypothetical protein